MDKAKMKVTDLHRVITDNEEEEVYLIPDELYVEYYEAYSKGEQNNRYEEKLIKAILLSGIENGIFNADASNGSNAFEGKDIGLINIELTEKGKELMAKR